MFTVRGKRVQREIALLKPAYQQQSFLTRSDEMLKRELTDLRKLLSSKLKRGVKSRSSCGFSDEEENHSQRMAPDEVSWGNPQDQKWKLEDDSSFVKVSENYSSSQSQSWQSLEKPFQNIKLPERKIKISDYLEQMRKAEREQSTCNEESKSFRQ